DSHFLARAAAEFDQRRRRGKKLRYVSRPLAENLKLATRQIIFRQRRDLLEQLRASLVVKVFRGEPLWLRAEAGDHVARERRVRIGVFIANSGLDRRSHDSLRFTRAIHAT